MYKMLSLVMLLIATKNAFGIPSPTLFINPNICAPGDYIEFGSSCCTVAYDIGYNFPFGCSIRTQYVAAATPSITFDPAVPCYYEAYPSVTVFTAVNVVLPQDGVATHMIYDGTEYVRVLEWSGIYELVDFVHVGTVQMWLFRNGTIGVTYHLTGQWFNSIASYNNNCSGCPSVVLSGGGTSLLRDHNAYLLVPSTEHCAAPMTITEWKRPPNYCFNEIRESYNKSALFIPDVDCSIANENYFSYCSNYKTLPADIKDATGVTYEPLWICPADQNNNTQFPLDSAASSLTVPSMMFIAISCLMLLF